MRIFKYDNRIEPTKFKTKLNKTAKIGVLGLGYVGLPLAVEVAKAGFHVIGFDVQEEKVAKINKGENYISDVLIDDFFIAPSKISIALSGTPLHNISQLCYHVQNFYTKVNLLKHLLTDKT